MQKVVIIENRDFNYLKTNITNASMDINLLLVDLGPDMEPNLRIRLENIACLIDAGRSVLNE